LFLELQFFSPPRVRCVYSDACWATLRLYRMDYHLINSLRFVEYTV
jgi:hypothetical protein